jgi:hypothetical protein
MRGYMVEGVGHAPNAVEHDEGLLIGGSPIEVVDA